MTSLSASAAQLADPFRAMPGGLVARAGLSAATMNRRYLLSVLVDESAEDPGQAREMLNRTVAVMTESPRNLRSWLAWPA
jgi:predicted exporter